jgi:D-alanyl-D-alanine carboxypeptidase/D-alanyl-D-alanine-endopeptidase (penicillin-binding protein 4)
MPLLLAAYAPFAVPAFGAAQRIPDHGNATDDGGGPAAARWVSDAASGSVIHQPATEAADPTPRAELAGDLDDLLTSGVRSGRWGALVVSLARGDTLYELNPDEPLHPASNMKLFTAALALDELGPQHQFSTDVLRDGPMNADGTVHGDLILRGDGDPGLSQRYVDGGASGPMNLLAQLVAGAGVKHVTGDLIADATAFDTARVPEGWRRRYLYASYAARVSALSLDENIVWLVVKPGGSVQEPATVTLDPATDIPLRSEVRTTAGRGSHIIQYTDNGTIVMRGSIGSRAGTQRFQVVVDDPPAFAAGALRHALAALGITVDGTVRFDKTPPGAVRVASLPSPPLARLVAAMNRESINHFAELLFRDAGRHASHSHIGSVTTGRALLDKFMTRTVGAAPGAVFTTDGCGLSVLDTTTPRALVQLLAYAHHAPWSDAFHASLPVAGKSELLRDRMRRTPAQGNLHAKTGTTNSIISLAGYVTARDGELLAFAFLYNGHDRWNARATIDQMGARLAEFARDRGTEVEIVGQ